MAVNFWKKENFSFGDITYCERKKVLCVYM